MTNDNKFIKQFKKRRNAGSEPSKQQTKQAVKKSFREQLQTKIGSIVTEKFQKCSEDNAEQNIVIYSGCTNSGKSYNSLLNLKDLPEGSKSFYLAPLRILAVEVYEKLNAENIPTSLITGQERKITKDAKVISATVEIYRQSSNSEERHHTVILDEAQLSGEDSSRGGSWTETLITCTAKNFYIICAPYAVPLISSILERTGRKFTVKEHQRFTPLTVADKPDKLNKIADNTILVAFSKNDVLNFKELFAGKHRNCMAIYGSLCPEVRRKQMEFFTTGEAKIGVSTDCLAFGVNVPAQRIILSTTDKWDGKRMGKVPPYLVQQLAGRAGRRGFFDAGVVSALNVDDLDYIRKCLSMTLPDLKRAYYMPSVPELAQIDAHLLADRLTKWRELNVIPQNLRDIITPIDLDERIELAQQLTEDQERHLGLEDSFLIINAPVSRGCQNYWKHCVYAICKGEFIPKPTGISKDIKTRDDLDLAENETHRCEIYLWLAHRKSFGPFCPDTEDIVEMKLSLSNKIDNALINMNMKMTKYCVDCGAELPAFYKHKMCDNCYNAW